MRARQLKKKKAREQRNADDVTPTPDALVPKSFPPLWQPPLPAGTPQRLTHDETQQLLVDQVAVARGWLAGISPEKLAKVAQRQVDIATNEKGDPRNASRAAAVLTKIIDQVMEQEKRDAEPKTPPTTILQLQGTVTLQDVVQEMTTHVGLAEHCRSRLAGGDASLLGHVSERITVGPVSSPAAD
jgi:hypothetical protein